MGREKVSDRNRICKHENKAPLSLDGRLAAE